MNKRYKQKRKKLLCLPIVLTLVFILLLLRLSYIMIIKHKEYGDMANEQWTNEIKIAAKRGKILDRNGLELAVSADVYRVDLDLKTIREDIESSKKKFESEKSKENTNIKLKDKKEIASEISNILNITEDEILNKLNYTLPSGNLANSAILIRRIEKDKADKIRNLKIRGIIVSPDTKRYYINDNFLSHVIGVTNDDSGGLSGVELQYNKELSGIPGIRISEVSRRNSDLPYTNSTFTPPLNGKNITLTIDEKKQFYAEEIAEKALVDNKGKSATVIVMNPKNGEILALANKPDFNPNNPFHDIDKFQGKTNQEKTSNMWKNWAISNEFECGSIFKIITTYAGLESGVVDENSTFYCSGRQIVNGHPISCWNNSVHGSENLQEILQNSCNPGFMQLGAKIGKEKLNECIKKFGLGKLSGVDLPGEAKGTIKPLDKISNIDLATISFGQTDTVNVVQFMAAFNAVANGGNLIEPHVMKDISHLDEKGEKIIDKTFKAKEETILDPSICQRERALLEGVIDHGSARAAKVEGLRIAGKTGTAEKPVPGLGYTEGKYISSFVAMAPADDPTITAMILVDEPNGDSHFAGVILTPLAHDLFYNLFTVN